jgi:hypothetical protein
MTERFTAAIHRRGAQRSPARPRDRDKVEETDAGRAVKDPRHILEQQDPPLLAEVQLL